MRRACGKILGSMPCARRKSLRTNSTKDMEEILRTKLSTIREEPECEGKLTPPRYKWMAKNLGMGKKKNIQAKDKKVGGSHVNLKQSYVLFVTGFASKGNFGGFLQY